jgi:hypothetical protein
VAWIISTASGTDIAALSPFMLVTAVSHWPRLPCACRGRIELTGTPANPRSLQRESRSNVAASASPEEIFRRGILFESVNVPNFDISRSTTQTTDSCARRRVSIGAIAESAILHGFLAPPAPGTSQSESSSELAA